jgi:hypothetical protein
VLLWETALRRRPFSDLGVPDGSALFFVSVTPPPRPTPS